MDAAEAFEKYKRNVAAAGPAYIKGAQTTKKDPVANAIRSKDAMRQKTIEAIDSGSWEAGLQRSGKAGWLKGIQDKGAARLAEGAAKSEQKTKSYMMKAIPAQQAAAEDIKARIPKTGKAGAMARVSEMYDKNVEIGRMAKGG